MSLQTLILIILAGISALLLALFQYAYKAKNNKLKLVFVLLRFLTVFAMLLLIINPKFEKETFYSVKPELIITIDNSQSVNHLNQVENTLSLVSSLRGNEELHKKFDIRFYDFGSEINATNIDSLSFSKPQTNISKAFHDLSQIYNEDVAPTILISDGNQTYGYDYEYDLKSYNQPIYPVILGDTITYTDLKIQQLNVNKYAYLKNNFPVEIMATYNGNKAVSTQLIITSGNSIVHRQRLDYSKNNNANTINITLPANRAVPKCFGFQVLPSLVLTSALMLSAE